MFVDRFMFVDFRFMFEIWDMGYGHGSKDRFTLVQNVVSVTQINPD